MRLKNLFCGLLLCVGALSIDLSCEFEDKIWHKVPVKLCDVKNVIIINPNETVVTVNGENSSSYVGSNVKQVTISEQTLKFIPRGLEKFFPNLEILHIHYSKLQSLTQSDLRPFAELFDVSFHNNELTTLDNNLLELNTKVRFINLNDNKLKKIGPDFAKPLGRNFEQINIQGNPCIDNVYYPDDAPELVNVLRTSCT